MWTFPNFQHFKLFPACISLTISCTVNCVNCNAFQWLVDHETLGRKFFTLISIKIWFKRLKMLIYSNVFLSQVVSFQNLQYQIGAKWRLYTVHSIETWSSCGVITHRLVNVVKQSKISYDIISSKRMLLNL